MRSVTGLQRPETLPKEKKSLLPRHGELSNVSNDSRSKRLFPVAFNDLLRRIVVITQIQPGMKLSSFPDKFDCRVECERRIRNRGRSCLDV